MSDDRLKKKIEKSVAQAFINKTVVKHHNALRQLENARKLYGSDSNRAKRLEIKVAHFKERCDNIQRL